MERIKESGAYLADLTRGCVLDPVLLLLQVTPIHVKEGGQEEEQDGEMAGLSLHSLDSGTQLRKG